MKQSSNDELNSILLLILVNGEVIGPAARLSYPYLLWLIPNYNTLHNNALIYGIVS